MHTFSAMVVFARLPFLRPALTYALLLAASAAYAAGPTGLLNDTGQTQCDNGSNVMAACTIGNTGDAATYKRQDGRFGRDPAAPAKVGGGVAGFDFTRVCFNGDLEGAGTCTGTLVANTTAAATGTPSTDWACTQDNVTKLIWSLQTQSATWNAASAGTYPDAGHNTPIRCGFSTGWRLPTRRELLSIVHLGLVADPMVDANYFPATQSDWYWTSDDYAPNTANAWVVDFNEGGSGANVKTDTYYVRLVRSQPPPPTSVAWANIGGFVPEVQGDLTSGVILAGNQSFAGATGLALVSLAGGTISGLGVNGSGQLVFDYTPPFADPDTLRLTGTDRYGNAFAIDLLVALPF